MNSIILTKILTLPGIIVGLSFHEYAHAWMSDKLGDPTPRRQGRLTISPMAHIDIVGFIALILCGFGWGKPVEINPYYYKKPRRDEFLVSVAGITCNLILAVIFAIPTKLVFTAMQSSGSELLEIVFYVLYYTVTINLMLMIFNLIPCPPLDGFGIVTEIFNLKKYSWWPQVYRYGSMILLVLIITNLTDLIITPAINFFLRLLF